ncbi:MAG TPA: hypothetical protein VK741_21765 [Acetobacteraceae bacterium]|nr:hypothetical protein [Acetobacteraceae bacterium]
MQSPTFDKAAHYTALLTGRVTLRWLKAFDPDAYGGRGFIDTTPDRAQAMRFPSFEAAMECWRTQSRVKPLRDDGQPNRPLTAHTVQPVEVVD